MKAKPLLLAAVMLLFMMLTATAQDVTNQRLSSKDAIPFGKKLPPPDLFVHISYSCCIIMGNSHSCLYTNP
jgi:hypothetical protein